MTSPKTQLGNKVRKEIKRLGYDPRGKVSSKSNEMFSMLTVNLRGMTCDDQDSVMYFISTNETYETRNSFEIDIEV